jgi:hypothetical protein
MARKAAAHKQRRSDRPVTIKTGAAVTSPSDLTETEQDLLSHLQNGYELETDTLGSDVLLRQPKDTQHRKGAGRARIDRAGEKRRSAAHPLETEQQQTGWEVADETCTRVEAYNQAPPLTSIILKIFQIVSRETSF